MTQDLIGNSLLCVFMADDFTVQSVFSASLCIICSWLWCWKVNTGWRSVAWVVWYWAVQQLCRRQKGARSSVKKIACISPIIVLLFFTSLEQKWRGAYLSDSQVIICECWLGWIIFWYITTSMQIWSRVWKLLLTDCAYRMIHTKWWLIHTKWWLAATKVDRNASDVHMLM